jgi:hypothetical protein
MFVAVRWRPIAIFERPQCNVVGGRQAVCGYAVARHCGGRRQKRADFAAVLGFRSRCETRCTHCVRCARTVAASQFTKRAGTRTDRNPALLAAAQAHRRTPAHGLAKHRQFFGGVVGQEPGIEPGSRPAARLARLQRAASLGLDARGLPNTLPKELSLPQGLGQPGIGRPQALPSAHNRPSTVFADVRQFTQWAANRQPFHASRNAPSAVEPLRWNSAFS